MRNYEAIGIAASVLASVVGGTWYMASQFGQIHSWQSGQEAREVERYEKLLDIEGTQKLLVSTTQNLSVESGITQVKLENLRDDVKSLKSRTTTGLEYSSGIVLDGLCDRGGSDKSQI